MAFKKYYFCHSALNVKSNSSKKNRIEIGTGEIHETINHQTGRTKDK